METCVRKLTLRNDDHCRGSFWTGTCSISKVSVSGTGIEIEAFSDSESLIADFSKSWSDICISVIGGRCWSTWRAVTGIGLINIEAFTECRLPGPVLPKLWSNIDISWVDGESCWSRTVCDSVIKITEDIRNQWESGKVDKGERNAACNRWGSHVLITASLIYVPMDPEYIDSSFVAWSEKSSDHLS